MLTVEQKNKILSTLNEISDLLIDNNIDFCNCDDIDAWDIKSIVASFDDSIKIYNGVSKLVFYMPLITEEYCIKMPFHFISSGDVCAYEMDLYNSIEDTYKEIFMKEEHIGYVDNVPIYIQPYVETLDMDMEIWDGTVTLPGVISKKQKNEAKYYIKNFGSKSHFWNYSILKYYGFKMGKQILEVVGNFQDLHDENVGYLANGRPVVFDYGGYV
jgi:hypothetical protein